MAKGKKKDKKAKKKDKNAPKKAISAFFFYNKERRPILKKEQPSLDNKQIIKTMSEEWNKLSDEKKKPYIAKAEADKKRYAKEKEEYDKTHKVEKKSTKKSEKKGKKTKEEPKKESEEEEEED